MKKTWIEYLRVLSVIAVVIGHSTGSVYNDFAHIQLHTWWIANVLTTLSRFSVPVFIMISGCLLLGKEIDIQNFYRKRGRRLLPALFFWSLFYITFDYLFNHRDLKTILWNLTLGFISSGKAYHHLWYLSMFVCLMLFAPFVNNYITGKKPNKKDFIYIFSIFALLLFLNQVSLIGEELFEANMSWFKSFPWYMGYFVMGYFINKYINKIDIKNSTIAIVISCILIIGCTLNFYFASSLDIAKNGFTLHNHGILNFILSISIFYFFAKNKAKLSDNSFIVAVSSKSFGIYLIHPFFISIFSKYMDFYFDSLIIYMILLMTLTFIFSLLSISLLTKFKLFRSLC